MPHLLQNSHGISFLTEKRCPRLDFCRSWQPKYSPNCVFHSILEISPDFFASPASKHCANQYSAWFRRCRKAFMAWWLLVRPQAYHHPGHFVRVSRLVGKKNQAKSPILFKNTIWSVFWGLCSTKTQARATLFIRKINFVRVLKQVRQKSRAQSPILCEKRNVCCIFGCHASQNTAKIAFFS